MPRRSPAAWANKRTQDLKRYYAFKAAGRPWKAGKRTPAQQAFHSRKSQLKIKYGLTLEDYAVLSAQQHGLCAICRQPEYRKGSKSTKAKRLAIDHNHTTHRVRGLLCHDCNIALGLFHDDPLRIQAALVYVSKA